MTNSGRSDWPLLEKHMKLNFTNPFQTLLWDAGQQDTRSVRGAPQASMKNAGTEIVFRQARFPAFPNK